MSVWDTEENNRSNYTHSCLYSLLKTVDFDLHSLIVVDNGSCERTKHTLHHFQNVIRMMVIENETNVGQAAALNQAFAYNTEPSSLIRIDNDIIFKTEDWVEILEETVERDSTIGIAAAKRRDLIDSPNRPDGCWSKTSLRMLNQERGQRWIAVEDINETLGSVQLINKELFKKIGYLDVFGKWGLEDHGYAVRAKLAGFKSCYVCGIDIEHLDDVQEEAPYQLWKRKTAAEMMPEMDRIVNEYKNGTRPLRRDA